MSLKARIEAVIYAAEEPVTLAQLGVLFGEEALEQKQLREAEAAAEAEALAAESAAIAEADAEEAEAVVAEPATEHAAEGAEREPAAAEELRPEAWQAPEAADSPDAQPIETEAAVASEQEAAVPSAETGEVDPAVEPAEESPDAEDDSAEESGDAAEPDEKKLARLREREIRDELRRTLDELIEDYAGSERGMEIREVAGGYRVGTRPEYHDSVRAFVKSLKPPIKLSLQALETLAVIAYKQPITAPEVSEIRGVDSAGVIGSLISRKLVTTAGRKQVIGRPILYKTTKEFLLRFGLKDLNELPSMEEFEKMSGELAENAESEPLPFEQARRPEGEDGAEAAAVPMLASSGRPRVVVAIPEHHGTIALTDESTFYEDLPGVAVAVSEVVEVVTVSVEAADEAEAEKVEPDSSEPEETPHA